MDSAFPLFAADNTLDEYYAMKPALNEIQVDLLHAFYRARRETNGDERCKAVELEKHAQTIAMDSDIVVHILQKVDDEYMAIQLEKIKRAQKP
jgi:hypothetical protein